MLYIRKLKPQLNKQIESELFTLIIRNLQLENSITRNFQKYLNENKNKQNIVADATLPSWRRCCYRRG